MAITILEQPNMTGGEESLPEQSNVAEGQDVETRETSQPEAGADEAVGGAEGSQQQPEPEISIGDRKMPLSKVEQALRDAENNEAWKDKNRRESEELNARRKRVERLELLEPMLEGRQDILQQLLTPTPKKDYDADIAAHFAAKPTDSYDAAAMSAWEMKRDMLNSEKTEAKMEARIEMVRAKEEAGMHNSSIETAARERFIKSKKVDEADFERMTEFVLKRQLFDQRTGKAHSDAYDLAYKSVFADRYERDIRADATRRTVDPIRKGTSGGADAGITQRTPQTTQAEVDDNDFVAMVKHQSKGNYQKL